MAVRKIWTVSVIENYFIIDTGIKAAPSDKPKSKFSNSIFFSDLSTEILKDNLALSFWIQKDLSTEIQKDNLALSF